MLSITAKFSFEAAHHLPYYKGKCNNLHGHSYTLDVTVSGSPISNTNNEKCGMIMDFKDLKTLVSGIISKYDHSNLNDFFENPTAEKMVMDIGEEILDKLPHKVFLYSVKLWETPTNYAEYRPTYFTGSHSKPAT